MAIFKGKVVMGKNEEYVIEFLGSQALGGLDYATEQLWREKGYPIYGATLLIENGEASQQKVAPLVKSSQQKNETKRLRLVRTSRKKVKRSKKS